VACAQRHPDSDLVGPAGDRVCQQTRKADRGQGQCGQAEGPRNQREKPFGPEQTIEERPRTSTSGFQVSFRSWDTRAPGGSIVPKKKEISANE